MSPDRPVPKGEKFSFFNEAALPAPVKARFLARDRRDTLRNIRLVSILGAVLIPLFGIVDYFAYREYFSLFAVFRVICTLSVIGLWKYSETPSGRKNYRLITVLLPVVPAFFIAMMIGCSQDPGSPYYAGLTLCLVAMGFVFHWTYREAFISSIAVLIMYLVACIPGVFPGWQEEEVFAFISNLVFILATGLVITSGSFAHHKIRVGEFRARDELRQSQTALASKNTELRQLVDELNETERQLIQSEKMASLGQLSAGVIHEIGNPLNFSCQALYVLKKKVRQGGHEDMSDIIDDMQEGYDRIKDIVSELREFSHKGEHKNTSFLLVESVTSAMRILSKQIETQNILVSVKVDKTVRILGVKNQITQVIINLVQNAVQAIENSENHDAGKIGIASTILENEVAITITDNGPGIERANCSKLFDPFFTTKQPGEGTGLGLSICYRIIDTHEGSLEVDSKPGQYTRFKMILPMHQPVNSTRQKFITASS